MDSNPSFGTPNSSSQSPSTRETTTTELRLENPGVASGRISVVPRLTLDNQSEVRRKVVRSWYGNERTYTYLYGISASIWSNMGQNGVDPT